MQVAINYLYRTEEIPPGKRKAVPVEKEGYLEIEVREVSGQEAPVAIVEYMNYQEPNENERRVRYWRWFEEELWIDEPVNASSSNEKYPPIQEVYKWEIKHLGGEEVKQEPNDFPGSSSKQFSQEERESDFHKWTSRRLIVDGTHYQKVSRDCEPRFWINNQPEYRRIVVRATHSYFQGLKISQHYRIDQPEVVLEEALERVDRLNWQIVWTANYHILIPDAIRLDPIRDQQVVDQERFDRNVDDLLREMGRHCSSREGQVRLLEAALLKVKSGKGDVD